MLSATPITWVFSEGPGVDPVNITSTTRPLFISFWRALSLHCRSSFTKAQKLTVMRQQFGFKWTPFLSPKNQSASVTLENNPRKLEIVLFIDTKMVQTMLAHQVSGRQNEFHWLA